MWDILNALFWFAMGMVSLAGVYHRADEIAGRFDERNLHDGY